MNESEENDLQIAAIPKVYEALKGLSPKTAFNVLSFVCSMVAPEHKLQAEQKTTGSGTSPNLSTNSNVETKNDDKNDSSEYEEEDESDDLDGISSIGHKWMKRTGITNEQLGILFSLGLDEIDLVAKSIPGKSIKEKMRSVFLLKGIASYLASGVARFSHEQAREACQHYAAWDSGNFAVYFKSLSSEVGGSKESGYTLTSRGITSATELIKSLAS